MDFLRQVQLIRKKNHSFICPLSGDEISLSWEFTKVGSPKVPLSIFVCSIQDQLGVTAKGCGDSLSPIRARRVAFYEAFERYMLHRYKKTKNNLSEQIISSNGIAAGKNPSAAVESSKEELLERHIITTAWSDMRGWASHNPKGIIHEFTSALIKPKGWEFNYFLVGDFPYQVLAGFLINKKKGFLFDAKFLKGDNTSQTETKLVCSLLRAYSVELTNNPSPNNFVELAESANPADHGVFYMSPENLEAIDFLSNPSSSKKLVIDDFNSITSQLLFESSDELPSVAMSTHPNWQQLKWGKQSITGKNPWPHPIA